MTLSVAFLLSMTFLISVGGLALLIWAAANDQFGMGQAAAETIFAAGEVGQIEDPATSGSSKLAMQRERGAVPQHTHDEDEELLARATADQSSRIPVLAWLTSAIVWLIIGSLFGLISSIKMHAPDWLVHDAFLTFGRVRPAHLNVVAYGWASMAGVGVAMWLIPRLFKTGLVGGNYATAGAVIWNIGMVAGTAALLSGLSTGLEWLEFPWYAALALTVAGGLAAVPLILTALQRRVSHLYVSTWYLIAALVWFPMLFVTANMPGLFAGVDQALMNWWFAHNVLGLWMTPLGLAAAYYFIPKIVGEPIYSYSLSLIGFWALALFYSQVGLHHLIGGPVPTWAVTISIVHSMMMLVPVIAVAVNQHMTVAKHFRLLKYSPTLRFVTLGAMMYTFASVQGSFEALRTINTVTHFTHYTVARAYGGLRVLLLRHVRLDLLHCAACDELGMAVPSGHFAPLLALVHRLWNLLLAAVDRWMASGSCNARREPAVHGFSHAHYPLPDL